MQALQKRARFIVLTSLVLLVVVLVPDFNDRTNIPKYSVLFFSVAFGASVLSIPKFGFLEKKTWKSWAPPVSFVLIMLSLSLMTDQKYTAFFGNYGRNNGWIQYLGFAVLFLLTALSFNFLTLIKLHNIFILLGIFLSVYGFLQNRGVDFLDKTNTGFPMITTFGNANFTSAFLGIASIALLWKISEVNTRAYQCLMLLVLVGQIYVLSLTNSSQGLFILLIGGSLFVGMKFFTTTKKQCVSFFSVYVSFLFIGILGLFQIGPLTRYVYESSISYRGDYYRAAWRMFKSHPFTGVGIDSFGDHYRTYRDMDAAFRLGPNEITNYAHNVFLQFLSTGGVFLFFAYVVMMLFVIFAVIQGFKKFTGKDKNLFGSLVSLWFAVQVQAQVSIDQIALAGIAWVLSGAIIALGFNGDLIADNGFKPKTYSKKRRGRVANSTLVSGGLTFVMIVSSFAWLSPIWRAEISIKQAQILKGNMNDLAFLAEKRRLALEAVASAPGEITYKLLASIVLSGAKDLELARQQLRDAYDANPKSYEAVEMGAQVYELAGLFSEAIKIRIVASQMDPNDTENWLKLAKNYAQVGDYDEIKEIIKSLKPLESRSTIADDLKALLPAVPTS